MGVSIPEINVNAIIIQIFTLPHCSTAGSFKNPYTDNILRNSQGAIELVDLVSCTFIPFFT